MGHYLVRARYDEVLKRDVAENKRIGALPGMRLRGFG
jgi:hypothetical protein